MKKAVFDPTEIANIIREKCGVIGRPKLSDVGPNEIKFIKVTTTGSQIISLRGMRYRVDLERVTFGIFDPVVVIGQQRKPRLKGLAEL